MTLQILKAGSKLSGLGKISGDFEDWILRPMQCGKNATNIIHCDEFQNLPELEQVSGVIITGSSAMITDNADWLKPVVNWVKLVVSSEIPILGICFGHQLLAHAMGGIVGDNPKGVEVGRVAVEKMIDIKNDPVFSPLPQKFFAFVSHRQSVLKLPSQAIAVARSDQDENLAIRFSDFAWGVQFHPEFDDNITKYYIQYYKEQLQRDGRNIETLMAQCIPIHNRTTILKSYRALLYR